MAILRMATEGDPRLDPYLRLTDRQLRSLRDELEARCVLESLNVIELAVGEGLELESVLVDERHLGTLLGRVPQLEEAGLPIYCCDRELLQDVTGISKSRGYLAVARRPRPLSAAEALRGARRVAVLEGLVDITNVGALFRSAAALGVDAMLLSPSCADPLNRRAIRVSMGTVFKLPWAVAEGDWPGDAFDVLRSEGFHVTGMALVEGALRLDDTSLKEYSRLALAFGSEGWGLSREALAACDDCAIIPMSAGVDSLNVAASSAVAFWELCARR